MSVQVDVAPTSPLRGGSRRRRRNVSAPGRPVKGRKHDTAAYVFLAPFFILFLVFIAYPFARAIWMGFFHWDLLTQRATNFGLGNYVRLLGAHGLTWSASSKLVWRIPLLIIGVILLIRGFHGRARAGRGTVVTGLVLLGAAALLGIGPGTHGQWNDPRFWAALQHTMEFTVLSTAFLVALGLAMALAVNRPGRTTTVYRAMFFLPYVLPVSVMTLIWIYFLNPDHGLLSALTDALGFGPINYLNSSTLAMPAVILATVWWTVGFNMVVFLAGLQDIDAQLYEAASLDGASRWAQFWHITLPGLKPVSVLVIFAQLVASFQIFGQVFLMTRGGPGDSTLVLIQDIYLTGIRDGDLGYASAQSVLLVIVILLISMAQLRVMRPKP